MNNNLKITQTPHTAVGNGSRRYEETKRVTLLGGGIDLILGILKIAVGKVAFSQSLVADGVHSLSDLITDALVIWAAKEANRGPDEDHPYGHQRIETVATVTLALLLVTVAVAIGYDAINGVVNHEHLHTPGVWALVVAALSVVSKELIYQYTIRVADRLQSDLLRSNAWHSRSDAMSSIVVIVGVGGAMLGFVYLDALAAVVVAVMIIYIAFSMIWRGVKELIDTGVDARDLAVMREIATRIEGVSDIHDLRTRRMGSDVYLDGHVLVNPRLSVSEGHRIGEAVYGGLKAEFPNLADVVIHIDAEDDEAYQKSSYLPLRTELIARLKQYWQHIPEANNASRTVLHYLNGGLQIEVWLPLSLFDTLDHALRTRDKIRDACAKDDEIAVIEVLFH